MESDRIDFISAYCDRWCERCAYSSHCSVFTADTVIAMCGDVREGLQLALGAPCPSECEPASAVVPQWIDDIDKIVIAGDQRAEFDRRENERDARISDSPIMTSKNCRITGAWRGETLSASPPCSDHAGLPRR